MKNLILTIVIAILILSCGGGGGGVTAPAATPAKSNILKINTGIYNKYDETADHLVNISVSNGSAGYVAYTMESLTNGIKIVTGTTVSLKVESTTKEEYPNNILWTGYAFSDIALAQAKEIEMVIDKDTYITLISTEDPTMDIVPVILSLFVSTPETFTNVGVKLNNSFYNIGTYDLFFAQGQSANLEAITTTNENVLFLGFQTASGVDVNTNTTIKLDNIETIIQADFVDKSLATVHITISAVNPELGSISVNGKTIIPEAGTDGKLLDYHLSNQSADQKIVLEAIPANEGKKFVSWSDDLSGYLSDTAKYEYVITSDAVINPAFSEKQGVVVVSILPRTNYFTGDTQHRQNMVGYTIKRMNGGEESSDGTSSKPHLTWENNTVSGLEAGDKVELTAIPGEGFYDDKAPVSPNDESKVTWSGDVSLPGSGYKKEVTIGDDGASKGANVNFTIEQRTVTVKLDNLKQKDPDVNNNVAIWEKEETKEDAKGYTIYINGVSFPNVRSVNKTFFWHTKVDVKVDGGSDYEVTNIIAQSLDNKNPEDEKGYNKDPSARISTLTFDLEKDNTVTADLHHKQVIMKLNIVGGKFNNDNTTGKDVIDPEYNGFINVKGTGYATKDINYNPEKYYDGITELAGSSVTTKEYSVPVLSGVPVNIYANPNTATLFRSHKSDLIPTGSTIKSNVVITNIGADFTLDSTFYAPIWTLIVNMRGMVEDNGRYYIESSDYKAGEYSYNITPPGGKVANIKDASTFLKVTNGLPLKIEALIDTGGHYAFYSMAGGKNATTNIISTNNSNVQVEFLHHKRKIKLNIYGGKDDRSTSYVEVSGSGVVSSDTKYYAKYKNIKSDKVTFGDPAIYEINVLSGIQSKLKLNAVTSPVHNFDKMAGTGIALNGTPMSGVDTYSITNSAIATVVPVNDDSSVGVTFRINSCNGKLNGRQDPAFQPDSNMPQLDTKEEIKTYNIYSASQLKQLSKIKPDNGFKYTRIRLMNDIYFGENHDFTGFENEFSGSFVGNGFIIFDLGIQKKGLFHNINGASINGLTTGRGYITGEFDSPDAVGLIAQARNSDISYVTNCSTIGSLTTVDWGYEGAVGGVISLLKENNRVSFAGNYGDVLGDSGVGGVIALSGGGNANNIKYLFNRGSVTGMNDVGGVVAVMNAGDRFYQLYNTGKVNSRYFSGGIVGKMAWSRNGSAKYGDLKIVNFYNTGDLSGASGIAGAIFGCREIMDGGIADNDMWTEALFNGYSIGNYNDSEIGHKQASLVYEAGHRADKGGHWINIFNTYTYNTSSDIKSPLKYGLGDWSGVDQRIDGDDRKDYVQFIRTTNNNGTIGNIGFYGNDSDTNRIKRILVSPNGDNGFNRLDTSLEGLDDGAIWVQTSRPNVNGFTSRPTFRDMPEQDLPSYMLEY